MKRTRFTDEQVIGELKELESENAHAQAVDDYNRERPHSCLGDATEAAFAAELDQQWPTSLRPTGYVKQAVAPTALMRNKAVGLQSRLVETRGGKSALLVRDSPVASPDLVLEF